MRVIAGSARSLKLKTIEGLDTRPTTDRIKETLFNMIQPLLCDSTFLDLFSGSGAIGIEALSRGAKSAAFVEQNKEAVDCIRYNLAFTSLEKNSTVIKQDVLSALKQLESGEPFDIIFMDPPYNKNHEKEVLQYLSSSKLIHDESLIIVEASGETNFSYVESYHFYITKIKDYKTNKHVFLKKSGL